jgi:hypothetical protein
MRIAIILSTALIVADISRALHRHFSIQFCAGIPMSFAIFSADAGSTHFTSAMKLTSAGLSALTLKRFFNAWTTLA